MSLFGITVIHEKIPPVQTGGGVATVNTRGNIYFLIYLDGLTKILI
ncbi:hypothetical protein HNQ85_001605 [Anoxybacillus calidus]|jgi:hypothetical protein|uniref:Uncharacterized protein n=1 Tax=[Anoxybacillus] calidus TaxID=575178 RepID=A0A7V9YZR9_9BACL|nr:hypothetical protein [Anoxybacillus calidus]